MKKNHKVEYDVEHLQSEYPGEITNTRLLKSFNKYLRDDDLNDITNFALKSKIREGVDYKLLPRDCWMMLQTKYKGLELKRFKDTDNYNRKFIIRFAEVII